MFVMEGLAVTADQAQMDVVSDKGDHSGPRELKTDVLDCLGNDWVASKVVVVEGAKDIQSGVLMIGDIG